MSFLNPLMLWSTLAVGIPIFLHFWHQKKGKLLPWAATQWLTEKDLQPSKGVRLYNILLLIVRCLLIILLAFILAKPLFKGLSRNDELKKIHLVQPNALVTDNFRFEIDEALKKGEQVYWMSDRITPLTALTNEFPAESLHPLALQTFINQINAINQPSDQWQYEFYLVNNQSLTQISAIFVPHSFSIHAVVDTLQKQPKNYLEVYNKKKVFVNKAHQLTVVAEFPPNEKLEEQPIHRGAINVLIEKKEKKSIKAALVALTEVYQIEFLIDEQSIPQKKYEWVFTDKEIDNKVEISDKLLQNGQLPEYLGELLVSHFQLDSEQKPLSQQQLQALFKTDNLPNSHNRNQGANISKVLLFLFVMMVGIERWLAFQKNA